MPFTMTSPYPFMTYFRKKTGTGQQTALSAVICICAFIIGLLFTGSPRASSSQLHQIDDRGKTPAVSVAIQMTAAPVLQETAPETEKRPPPQESPSQAELAAARQKKPVKSAKRPVSKPVPQPVKTAAVKTAPVILQATADTGENNTTLQQSGGQAISPTRAATDGRENQQNHDAYFAQLRHKIEEQKYYPRRARSAGQRGISTITFSLDNNGKPHSAAVTRSSGYVLLDNAALDAVTRVAAIGAPPQGAKRELSFSLRFELSNTM